MTGKEIRTALVDDSIGILSKDRIEGIFTLGPYGAYVVRAFVILFSNQYINDRIAVKCGHRDKIGLAKHIVAQYGELPSWLYYCIIAPVRRRDRKWKSRSRYKR